jgi:hypothetical protein
VFEQLWIERAGLCSVRPNHVCLQIDETLPPTRLPRQGSQGPHCHTHGSHRLSKSIPKKDSTTAVRWEPHMIPCSHRIVKGENHFPAPIHRPNTACGRLRLREFCGGGILPPAREVRKGPNAPQTRPGPGTDRAQWPPTLPGASASDRAKRAVGG